jgi:hypothetical protein
MWNIAYQRSTSLLESQKLGFLQGLNWMVFNLLDVLTEELSCNNQRHLTKDQAAQTSDRPIQTILSTMYHG